MVRILSLSLDQAEQLVALESTVFVAVVVDFVIVVFDFFVVVIDNVVAVLLPVTFYLVLVWSIDVKLRLLKANVEFLLCPTQLQC